MAENVDSVNMDQNVSQSFDEANVENELEMPWPAYSEVYTFDPKLCKDKNFAFICKLCIGKKIIYANRSSASNLKKHVKVCFIYLYRISFFLKLFYN